MKKKAVHVFNKKDTLPGGKYPITLLKAYSLWKNVKIIVHGVGIIEDGILTDVKVQHKEVVHASH